MIYLNPCLFFSLLVFVFFLNISCTFFSDTSCLVPWNLSELLTDNYLIFVWYFLYVQLTHTYPHTHSHTHPVNSRIYLFKADTKLLFPCSDPTELQTAALTGKFSLFYSLSQISQPRRSVMFCFHVIVLSNYSEILQIQIWKSEKKQEIPFNYQGQNEYQHFSWGWKGLFHVPPQIPHPTLKFPLNSEELRAEKGLPCFRST